MSLILAVILIVAILTLVLAVSTTRIVTITPDTEFIIDAQYTVLDDNLLLK